jgi:putative endonuclease
LGIVCFGSLAQSVPARTYRRSVRAGSSGLLFMYTVYVLEDKNKMLYKGLTNNLQRRFREHKGGHTITTSKMEDLDIIYTEEYNDFGEARKRELYFKSAAGRRFLKKKLGR